MLRIDAEDSFRFVYKAQKSNRVILNAIKCRLGDQEVTGSRPGTPKCSKCRSLVNTMRQHYTQHYTNHKLHRNDIQKTVSAKQSKVTQPPPPQLLVIPAPVFKIRVPDTFAQWNEILGRINWRWKLILSPRRHWNIEILPGRYAWISETGSGWITELACGCSEAEKMWIICSRGLSGQGLLKQA